MQRLAHRSFGGVISFMFADLIILPILVIYRKYYGTRMMLTLLGGFYVTMVIGGYLVELIFGVLNLQPSHGSAQVMVEGITWNYTTILNIIAFVLTAVLAARFLRTGGREMMGMMNGGPDDMADHDHGNGHDAPAHHGGSQHA